MSYTINPKPDPKPEPPSEYREVTKPIHDFGVMADVEKWERVNVNRELRWNGPKINIAQWREVMAFFRHIFERDNSEAHVRMFASPTGWKFHAFPQEARRGMMAKEIENDPGFIEQRARFKVSQGERQLGSAHTHCRISAFQSGGDHKDEAHSDGLHITLGHLDMEQWDIHGRFSISGPNGPKMIEIKDWEPFVEIPQEITQFLPPAMLSEVAKHILTVPPAAGQTFPAEWAENVKAAPPEPVKVTYTKEWTGKGVNDWGKYGDIAERIKAREKYYPSEYHGVERTDTQLVQLACDLFDEGMKEHKLYDTEIEDGLDEFNNHVGDFIILFCRTRRCSIEEILKGCELSHVLKDKEEAEAKEKQDDPPADTMWDHYMQ